MARDVNVDFDELIEFRDKFKRASEGVEKQAFIEVCAKELAARLLRKVIKRTPVGDYSDTYDVENDGEHKFLIMSDKQGGTLRRGWAVGEIRRVGNKYVIEVSNDVDYASYVEYGHRQTPGRYVPAIGKSLKKSWVPGKFMLTISEREIQKDAPGFIEKKFNNWLSEVLK